MAEKGKKSGKRYLIFCVEILIAAVLVLADQLIKKTVVANIKGQEDIVLIKNVIGLTYAENTGAAFSFMSDYTTVLSVFTSILLLACIAVLLSGKVKSKLMHTGIVMIIAGGAGNLIDRFAQGYVVDYIETLFVNFPIYNFADILVTCGVAVVCIRLIYETVTEEKRKKTETNTDGADANGQA
ncbi:MAG: signal peptidase II [Clostridiales bacterium]|nr:signal peptidase II [Clostridiales bacterium]